MNLLKTLPAVLVSCLVFLVFGLQIYLVMMRQISMDQATHDVVMLIVGVVVAKFGTVVDFWLGSSAGSREKDAALADSIRHDDRLASGG